MASFQNRLKKCMRAGNLRVADLARWFDLPYTTVREWVLHGREPGGEGRHRIDRRLTTLERKS